MLNTRIQTWFANHSRIGSCAASLLVMLLIAARILGFAHTHDEHGNTHLFAQSFASETHSHEDSDSPQDEHSCDLCDIILLGNSEICSTQTLHSVAILLDYTETLAPYYPEHRFFSCLQDRAPPVFCA
jgi:hypothetical protein